MAKLQLNLEDVEVETFSTVAEQQGSRGTVDGHDQETNYGSCTCIDNLCSGNCTGIGVECYTADPNYYHCSAEPCTGAPACTRGTCLTYWPQDETC